MDMYRYPSQFIRLKKQQWDKVRTEWENELSKIDEEKEQKNIDGQKRNLFNPFTKMRRKLFSGDESDEFEEMSQGDEESTLLFSFSKRPDSIQEMKQSFLDSIFSFQMKWASSTIRERSFVDDHFYDDPYLKYFLQRFPDTYFVLYKPVFLLKQAPVELEIILITPIATLCISFLEGEENSVFMGSKERFWIEKNGKEEKKVLSPLIGLNRTEKVIRQIYQLNGIELPIKKIILNRSGFFDYPFAPYDITFVDKKAYEEWFNSMRAVTSPLKFVQIKAAQSLLTHCHATYIKRQG
ncbi:hypothetical protein SAMN05216565_101200 [Litchfieldia salsa]|uniref:NERD domain-containing protein n=1 Tax=Litchfieldia salsa TaxID=930152 RepID=A0A1H0P850_9BACI|nr:hypothetical protein SAMN05216565_101200 [Litchfieldia salsa]